MRRSESSICLLSATQVCAWLEFKAVGRISVEVAKYCRMKKGGNIATLKSARLV